MLRRSLSRASHLLPNGLLQTLPLAFAASTRSLRSLSSHTTPETLNPSPSQEKESHENLRDPSCPTVSVSIDRSGLHNAPEHSHNPSSDSALVKHLKSIIKFRGGPISVAEYMEEVLTNPHSGFYINQDVFGAAGDFITSPEVSQMFGELQGLSSQKLSITGGCSLLVTSPEVSQMFGEMIGVWTMCLWEQMGRPEKVNLIELGPGRGTLMADLLRGSSKFVNFKKSLHIHMVECSPTLQKLQYSALKCVDEAMNEEGSTERTISMLSRSPVSWHSTLEEVPLGTPTIIIAHEFYDALPVHQFQTCTTRDGIQSLIVKNCPSIRTYPSIDILIYNPLETAFVPHIVAECIKHARSVCEVIACHELYDPAVKSSRGWCEKMVDVSEDSLNFRFVLSPMPTPATLLYLRKRCQWASPLEVAKVDHIEVCPKAMELTQQIAKRISLDGGGALIIDYGKNGIISDSLQAIRKHKFVNILDNPGSADLSAYVDFASIRHSAEEVSEHISVHGPITQSQFLGYLGINFRVEALLQNCTEEQAVSLKTGYWQLVGDGGAPFWEGPNELTPIGMGNRYLAMAIVNKKQGVPVPFE